MTPTKMVPYKNGPSYEKMPESYLPRPELSDV